MVRSSRRARILFFIGFGIAAVLFSLVENSATAQWRADQRPVGDRQPELLERTLAQLETTPATHPQIYFVGFAGYGREAVFKREVLAVRQLFDDRFGTKGRSIALVNHRSTVNDIPLANVSNLGRVLEYLGGLMDTRRDTLFLFLTSHGEEGVFVVDMPRLSLDHLRPQQLKKMLDHSRIKNRVIVVSSCHSGSFIPALADPNTLVIAASRGDRSSFGCEDRRQWTYFGDAYFNRALRQETSFRRAFERAKQIVTAWEAEDRLIPSLPQIAGGEALAESD